MSSNRIFFGYLKKSVAAITKDAFPMVTIKVMNQQSEKKATFWAEYFSVFCGSHVPALSKIYRPLVTLGEGFKPLFSQDKEGVLGLRPK